MLQFGADTARLLEMAYHGADFRRRRAASFDALDPQPGERIVDIGAGNGLLTLDLGRAVGESGRVWGIDPSEDMRTPAVARTSDLPQVTIADGKADALPLDDGSVDGAVSLQVFEYLSDEEVLASLAEAHRVLRANGRLVIGDMHFGLWTWASDDPARMDRMMASWRQHVSNQALPEELPKRFSQAGFTHITVRAIPFLDTVLRPDGLSRMMLILMENYAIAKGHLSADEAAAWAAEQDALASEGRFFHLLTHFVVSARRP